MKISTSTIKRLFGFAATPARSRLYTLDILAQYLGFKNYDELEIHIANPPSRGSAASRKTARKTTKKKPVGAKRSRS